MLCGECKLDNCCFEVVFLNAEHISDEYIESLNDKNHLIHSRNVVLTHTRESQVRYIKTFDFEHRFILGLVCSKSTKVLATATLVLDKEKKNVNLGILIFKAYSNRGNGTFILLTFSDFCFEILPKVAQEIGTRIQHHAMRKIALKVGFEFSREDSKSQIIYYVRSLRQQENLHFLKEPPLLVIANDAGGSAHLAAMLHAHGISPAARLSGPAVDMFSRFGVRTTKPAFPNQSESNGYILLGTSLFGGPESKALSEVALSGVRKIALLDHWVNYRERFHPSGRILPEVILVTNHLAYLMATEQFPKISILEVPDFQLAFLKLEFMKRVRGSGSALILFEPESDTAFSKRFPQVSFDKLINDVQLLAKKRGIHQIVLRAHPAHTPTDVRNLREALGKSKDIILSTNTNLIDDFSGADFVVGFNTYALYLASELRIPTFGYLADDAEHWSNHFPKISPLRNIVWE